MFDISTVFTIQICNNEMSNNRIFSGTARYQAIPQGRSANLTGGMFKRTPIFNHPSNDKQQPMSPFSNYNWKISESTYSQSQTSILQQKINPDIIKQMMKEQLSKITTDDSSRKMFQTSQAQISDLKDKMTEYEDYEKETNQKLNSLTDRITDYEKQNNQKLQVIVQQLKEEILSESEKMVATVQSQITDKFRNFFQIVNVEIKKDIIKVVSNEFLSFGYGEDLQNRLSVFNERLQAVDNLIQAKAISKPDERQKAIASELSKNYELKLSNLEKELQMRKKEVQNLMIRVNNAQEWVIESKERKDLHQILQVLQSFNVKVKQVSEQSSRLLKNINELQGKQRGTESDLKLLSAQLDQLNKNSDSQKLAMTDLIKKMEEKEKTHNQLHNFITNNDSCSSSIIIGNGRTLMSPTKVLSPSIKPLSQQITQQRQSPHAQKLIYQVDKDGYLMDGDGKYLLSDNNQMIWLSDEQISILLNSRQVQLIDS